MTDEQQFRVTVLRVAMAVVLWTTFATAIILFLNHQFSKR